MNWLTSPFTILIALLVISAGIVRFLDLLLDTSTKQKIQDSLEHIWGEMDESKFSKFILLPLRFLQTVLDIILGERLFSKTTLFRSFVVSLGILAVSLIATGYFTKTIFGFERAPWNYYENSLERSRAVFEMSLEDFKEAGGNQEIIERYENRIAYIQKMDSVGWQIAYTVFFVVFIIAVNALFDAIALSVSRRTLHEWLESKSGFIKSALIIQHVLLSALMVTVAWVAAIMILDPVLSLIFIELLLTLIVAGISFGWASFGTLATLVAIWSFSNPGFKLFAFTTVFPSLVFLV